MTTVLRSSARAVLAGALVLTLATGCGDDDGDRPGGRSADADDRRSTTSSGTPTTPPVEEPDLDLPGVPEECGEAFPFALDEPDLAEVTQMPADFPGPPVDAVLCLTEETSTHQSAKYATDVPPEEVLSAYEVLLEPQFFSRHEAGDGADVPSLYGSPDDVLTQIVAHDGYFEVFFSFA